LAESAKEQAQDIADSLQRERSLLMRRLLTLLLTLLTMAPSLLAQGVSHFNTAQMQITPPMALGISGNVLEPIPGAAVYVCAGSTVPPLGTTCAPTTPVYSCAGLTNVCQIVQPVSADQSGNYFFWAAPVLHYIVSVTGTAVTTYSYEWSAPLTDNGNSVISGNWSFIGNNTFTGSNTMANLNKILFVDGVLYPTLHAALAACPAGGCLIYDTIPETFSSDPYAGITQASVVQMGPGVWTTNVTVNVGPSTSRLLGTGRANDVNNPTYATTIKAGASFPAIGLVNGGSALVKLNGTQGTRLENIGLDCNSIALCSGGYATDINEQGGFFNLTITNTPNRGIFVDASSFSVIPAQNYSIRDIECFAAAAGSASTDCVHLKGNGGGGPDEVRNLTGNGQVGNVIGNTLFLENFNQGSFFNIHGEESVNVISMPNGGTCPSFITAVNVSGGPATAGGQNVINIPAGCTGTGYSFHNIIKNSATNSLVDAPRSFTLTDADLTAYIVGPGALNSQEIYSTSPSVGKVIVGGPKFLASSLIVNGTQVATPTTPLKTGSGSGNYTGTNTTYASVGAVVDSTNLCYAVTIPPGWKLSVVASGVLESVTAAVAQSVSLTDLGTTCGTTGANALAGSARTYTPPAVGTFDVGFSTSAIITGDGAVHAIALQALTSAGGDAWGIQNTSATVAPSMSFLLTPSN
jgi:hypothetical protein